MNSENRSKKSIRLPLFVGPMIALVLVVILFAVLDSIYSQGKFFTNENLSNIAIQICVYALAAVGLTVVIISGGIDLSCGTAVALSATVVAFCMYHDIGSRIFEGTNVRDPAVRLAQLIEDGADPSTIEAAKEKVKSLIEQRYMRTYDEEARLEKRLKDGGWSFLPSQAVLDYLSGGDREEFQRVKQEFEAFEEKLKEENPAEYERFDRLVADIKRLRENRRVLQERLDELEKDDFFLMVDTAKQQWGQNVPNHPATVYIAILAGILTGFLCGVVNGFAVAFLKIVPFVVTLGTMTIFLGIGNLISGNVPIRTVRGDMVPSWVYQSLSLNSEYLFLGLPPGVWTLVVAAIAVAMVLRSTVFGRYSFALGSNESTARLCGINVSYQKLLIYALSGALIGLAGVFQFSRLTVGDPESGLGLELKVIAAVVIGGGSLTGGRGSIVGTLCGAIMLAVILNGCTQLGLPTSIEKIVVGAIIIFAVFLDQPAPKQFLRKIFGQKN